MLGEVVNNGIAFGLDIGVPDGVALGEAFDGLEVGAYVDGRVLGTDDSVGAQVGLDIGVPDEEALAFEGLEVSVYVEALDGRALGTPVDIGFEVGGHVG